MAKLTRRKLIARKRWRRAVAKGTWHRWLAEGRLLIGWAENTTSHNEKLISAIGATLGMLGVGLLTLVIHRLELLDLAASYLVVASMGASAVLLFAVPQGALSQPWAVVGGHLISAAVGVSCYTLLGDTPVSAALSVGLAVGAMHYLRCIHPPGGATALTAVIGGSHVHALGFHYLVFPILINALILMLVAVLFNSLFAWRRYPAHLTHRHKATTFTAPSDRHYELTQEDFSAAMHELDSYFDVTSEGLTDLLERARQHAEKSVTHPAEIIAGRFYSNGRLGNLWSVRQVIDNSGEQEPSRDKVIYKVVAGNQSYLTGICLRSEFRQWARFEVEPVAGHWIKIADHPKKTEDVETGRR